MPTNAPWTEAIPAKMVELARKSKEDALVNAHQTGQVLCATKVSFFIFGKSFLFTSENLNHE